MAQYQIPTPKLIWTGTERGSSTGSSENYNRLFIIPMPKMPPLALSTTKPPQTLSMTGVGS